MILIAYEGEVSSKCHNESLDIMHNSLLYQSFVHIFFLCIDIFHIDVIKQILIFEHPYSFHRLSGRWYCLYEIIWSSTIRCRYTSLQYISQCIFIPLMHYCLMYTKQNLIDVFCFVQNLHMMREADAQELISVNFARQWRPFCQRQSITFYFGMQGINS